MAKSQYKDKDKNKPPIKECSTRIDELAKPRRFFVLGTWQNYGYLFEPKRMQSLKEKVQELFSMTPEETELYFNSLRQKKPNRIDMKTLRMRIKKEKAACRREAYLIFHKLLKKAMKYAYKHAPPLLMTPMLRIISDHVLEVLAELHNVDVPKRTDCNNIARFLICLSDWTAIFISNIYYNIEVEERTDIQQMKMLDKIKSKTSTVGPKTSTTSVVQNVTDYDQQKEENEAGYIPETTAGDTTDATEDAQGEDMAEGYPEG